MKTLGAVALPLILALASSCGPSEAGDDDDVDAGGDALVTGREFTTDCRPTTRTIAYADGSITSDTHWTADIEPPFDWSRVTVRMCNPTPSAGADACPAGATCSGTSLPEARCAVSTIALTDFDAAGRAYCGYTYERTSASGVVTRGGQHYQHATFRAVD